MNKFFFFVIGGHYGDEAKGKITDILAPQFDVVVRGSGGANAGHTIIVGDKKIAMHLLPVGVLHKGPLNVLGAEMMIDPEGLSQELIVTHSWNPSPKLRIASKANLVMEWHKAFDGASEQTDTKIGTTKRGIGPAAESKYARRLAITVADAVDPNMGKKVRQVINEIRLRLVEQHTSFSSFRNLSVSEIMESKQDSKLGKALSDYATEQERKLAEFSKQFKEFVVEDVGLMLSDQKYGKILGEGAQGAMLDPTMGLLPYTTSTPTTVHGISRGMQLEPMKKDSLGVFKAYETRVGEGPFPTAMEEKLGIEIQKRGGEFGATTGRGRRCGWFNLEEAQYAARTNGLTWMAITKLDVLDELDVIQLGLKSENGVMKYKSFTGWKQDTTKCRSFSELPKNAQDYLLWLQQHTVPLALVSVGPERSQTIFMDSFKTYLKGKGVVL